MSENVSATAKAVTWVREFEAEMGARRFDDTRGLANITLKMPVDPGSTLSSGNGKLMSLLPKEP